MTGQEIAIIILSSTLVIFIFAYIKSLMVFDGYSKKNKELSDELEKSKNELSTYNFNTAFIPGRTVLIKEYGVSNSGENFKADFIATITKVTKTNVQVSATDVKTISKYSTPPMKQSLLDFMTGRWVEIEDVELIKDETYFRDIKLNALL